MATTTQKDGASAPHNAYDIDDSNIHPPHYGMTAREYLASRITSLKPPMTKAPNPIRLIRMLTLRQWAFFGVAFWAWVSPVYLSSVSSVAVEFFIADKLF